MKKHVTLKTAVHYRKNDFHFFSITEKKKHFKIYLTCNNNLQYYSFYFISDKINAAFLSIRDVFQKKISLTPDL